MSRSLLLLCYITLGFSQYGTGYEFPGIRPQYEDELSGIIKWYFDESTVSGLNTMYLSPNAVDEIKDEIRNAFNIWDMYISSTTYPNNITFVEGSHNDYTIKISFVYNSSNTQYGSTTCIGADEIGAKSNIMSSTRKCNALKEILQLEHGTIPKLQPANAGRA